MDYFQRHTSIVVAFWSALMETQDSDTTDAKSPPSPKELDTMETQNADSAPISEQAMEEDISCLEGVRNGDCNGREDAEGEDGERETKDAEREDGKRETKDADGEREIEDREGESGEGRMEGERGEGVGPELLTREQLIELFRAVSPVPPGSLTTVGMVSLLARSCYSCMCVCVCVMLCRWAIPTWARAPPSMLSSRGRKCLSLQPQGEPNISRYCSLARHCSCGCVCYCGLPVICPHACWSRLRVIAIYYSGIFCLCCCRLCI